MESELKKICDVTDLVKGGRYLLISNDSIYNFKYMFFVYYISRHGVHITDEIDCSSFFFFPTVERFIEDGELYSLPLSSLEKGLF